MALKTLVSRRLQVELWECGGSRIGTQDMVRIVRITPIYKP